MKKKWKPLWKCTENEKLHSNHFWAKVLNENFIFSHKSSKNSESDLKIFFHELLALEIIFEQISVISNFFTNL